MPDDPFQQDSTYELVFPTALGLIVFVADVRIVDRELTLENVLIEPLQTRTLEIGVGAVLALRRFVMEAARAQGYNTLVVDGWRISGANPQRRVHLGGEL